MKDRISLWSFYGLYFSEKTRKLVEQKLLDLEKEQKENCNWPFEKLEVHDEKDGKLGFTFTFRNESIKKLEIDMGEKVLFFHSLLSFSNVEYYGPQPNVICLGTYFLKSEKKWFEEYLGQLTEALKKV